MATRCPSPSWVRTVGPPGPVEVAISLLAHAALRDGHRHVPALLTKYGLDGTGRPPMSATAAAAEHHLPASTVTDLLDRFRPVARRNPPPPALLAGLDLLGDRTYDTAAEASQALLEAGVTAGPVCPDAIIELAHVLHVPLVPGRPRTRTARRAPARRAGTPRPGQR